MIIAQYLPQWLRSRLRKPAPQNVTNVNKKDRQVLPTLTPLSRATTRSRHADDRYWLLWRNQPGKNFKHQHPSSKETRGNFKHQHSSLKVQYLY